MRDPNIRADARRARARFEVCMGIIRVISHNAERFSDRRQAGALLAMELKQWRGRKAVVLGIPRGGIIVAEELSRRLEAELDIVLSRKLGAPNNPELAVGSVTEDGNVFLNEEIVSALSLGQGYIEKEKAYQMREIERRIALFRKARPKISLKDKSVIVTDDGVATGATMKAALWAARQEHPKKLIAALPVGPPETIQELSVIADEVLCLRAPEFFSAVGQFYAEFGQVEDEEVLEILKDRGGA